MIPLYGFLEGDTLGLLMLTDESETLGSLAQRLEASAGSRVVPAGGLRVMVAGRQVESDATVAEAGLEALDRFDVTHGRPSSPEGRGR